MRLGARQGPSAITYTAASGAGEQAVQLHKAMVLLATMQLKGVALNAIVRCAAISACAKAMQHRKALELLFRCHWIKPSGHP